MRVLLVGNFAADGQYSMQGFVHALSAGLTARGVSVERIQATPLLSRHANNVHVGAGKWLGYIDKYLLFPPKLRQAATRADLVHVCDQGNGIYMRYLENKPHLLTCHDLLAMRAAQGDATLWPVSGTGRIYQRLIWSGIRRARHVACISTATQNDLLRLLKADPAGRTAPTPSVRCILHCLFATFYPEGEAVRREVLVKAKVDPDTPYLLHVGGNQPYKNRPGLLAIFDALIRRPDAPKDVKLVLVGKPVTDAMRRFIGERRMEDRVLERTGLEDAVIRALYSHALALVFPSTIEGFGLPIIEAQACACPVFASDRAPMTEAGGDGAAYFNPDAPEGAAQVIAQGLVDREGLAQRVKRGQERIYAHFQLERMVSDYISLYESILGGKR
jgi:glycosyltransferase involved in cell wall biosynthesis